MDPKYCSPENEKNKYSCFSDKSLRKIAEKYNKYNNDKIEIPPNLDKLGRKQYTEIIKNKMNRATNCSEEYCWLGAYNLDSDNELSESFRPKKPHSWNSNQIEWLSTTDINKVLEQYEKSNPDYKYFGAVPIDFDMELSPGFCVSNELCKINVKDLYLNGYRKLGIVFNLDKHNQSGSHWVTMYVDMNNGGIYYFDSYANEPPTEVKILMEKIRADGNRLIEDGIIDIEEFDDDYQSTANIIAASNNSITVPSNSIIQEDTPLFIRSNETGQLIGGARKIINTQYGGIEDLKIQLDKNLTKLPNNKGILQRGFKKFYNNIRFQYKGSECGVYSIHFQTELLKGKSFYNVIKNIIDDDTINRQRDYYYRPSE